VVKKEMIYLLSLALILSAMHYYFFLLLIKRGLKRVRSQFTTTSEVPLLTVIIPFRNESEVILQSLESIKSQTYPKNRLQVLFVDDMSDDDSYYKLSEAVEEEYIDILQVPVQRTSKAMKKRAITYALSFAKGEIIVGTDADCLHPTQWLETMVSYFSENTALVAGPVKFTSGTSLFDKIQEIEHAGLTLAGAGLIGAGLPTIASAANIAYRKSVFDEVGGFTDNEHLSSGDDELLMQKISRTTTYDIRFCYNSKALVTTQPNSSINQFYQQRKRWASKGLHYEDIGLIAKLVGIFLYFLLQLTAAIVIPIAYLLGLAKEGHLVMTITGLIVKVITEYAVMREGRPLLYDKIPHKAFFLAELIHLPYIILAAVAGVLGQFTWKGRKVAR